MSLLNLAGLFANGCIAFGLNVVSFTANKKAGPLSMTVAGVCPSLHFLFSVASQFLFWGFNPVLANIKQVLTILIAVLLFNLNITFMNGAGIIFTLAGGAWYGYVDYDEKRWRRNRERTLNT
jgi:hypothetical protein